jgi:hypothetical protein
LLLAADTTLTTTSLSRDMQMGRDVAVGTMQALAKRHGCVTYTVDNTTMTLDGDMYRWTVTATCRR